MTAPGVARTAPYGSWSSPITADPTAAGAIGVAAVWVDSDDIYWLEARPTDAGRQVLVRRNAHGAIADVTPPPYNVRTRVHEYGGGSYAVDGGTVWFTDFADQRLYRLERGEDPRPITGADGHAWEVRNRVALCRCGHSKNKPFCNGAHASMKFKDGLVWEADGVFDRIMNTPEERDVFAVLGLGWLEPRERK